MKKLILTIGILLPIACFAQNKIEGIGKYKIGHTINEMIPQSEMDYISLTYLDDAKIIGTANIADFHIVEDVLFELELSFYNDTLYEIDMRRLPDNFLESFKLKFGEGEKYLKKYNSVTRPKVIFQKDESLTWTTDNIKASFSWTTIYEPDFDSHSSFMIWDMKKFKKANLYINEYKKSKIKKDIKDLSEKL